MQFLPLESRPHNLVSVLKACASKAALVQGKLIHADIVKNGLEKALFVGTTVVDMYAKCGSLQDACKTFDQLPVRDVVSWTSIILAHAECGHGWKALQLYEEMQKNGLEPNNVTFVCLLKACTSVAALDQGKLIHTHVLKQGLASDLLIGTSLVNMYVKCGSLENARHVFDNLLVQNGVSWSAIIAGYAVDGFCQEALQLFWRMCQEGIDPDEVTYVVILKICACTAALGEGRMIHLDAMERGLESCPFVGGVLIDMYAKCNSLQDACKVFDKLPVQSVVSWSALIAGFAEHGQGGEALHLFARMIENGKQPNKVTFICLLKACSGILAIDEGKHIHNVIIEQGLEFDMTVQNALVDMYIKFGSLEDAHKVFETFLTQDVVLWSTMIAGYVESGHFKEALQLYDKMQQKGTGPNEVTFVLILKACSGTAALEMGKLIHAEILRCGFESDRFVGNALVDMYAKNGKAEDVDQVFENLLIRDVVSWNAVIAGYAYRLHNEEALELFKEMVQEGAEPNQVTCLSIIKACSSLATLDHSQLFHAEIMNRGLESDLLVQNSLIGMYAKCGSLEDACKLFDELTSRDVITWNVMILGCAEHGHSDGAQQYFKRMLLEGTKPDYLTFICILSAYGHEGLLLEGYHYFKSMMENFGLVPTIEHYACMVSILGRAGCLNDAEDVVLRMPLQPNAIVWVALLGSCTKNGNLEVGKRVFDCLVEADCTSAAGYVLLSNIHADHCMWQCVQKVQDLTSLNKV